MKNFLPFDSLIIDRLSDVPLQRQLYGQLRRMIEERMLSAGSRLPSSRALASELSLSRNTVTSAYEQLATEGYVTVRRGALPEVARLEQAPLRDPRPLAGEGSFLSERGRAMSGQPYHHGSVGHLTFHPGMPDPQAFPFRIWGQLLSRRAMTAHRDLFGSYNIAGYPELRQVIADYVKVSRGVRCTPEQIVVTTGVQAALDLMGRVLLDPGDAVWMEEPGYYGAQASFVGASARLLPLHVGPGGWGLEPPAGPSPRLIYVTPASQQPLGQTMPMEQRLRLLEVAERLGAFVVEDDFDGEYRFAGQPMAALQGAGAPDRVIYLGTFAKLLFPALRIGFMVLPEALVPPFERALVLTGQYPPLLLQAALADFIREGHMTTHLKRMRRLYASRRQLFIELCTTRLNKWLTVLPNDAGISLAVELRKGADDRVVTAAARRRGLHVPPLSMHFRHGGRRDGFLVGYAATPEIALPRSLEQLEAVLRETLGD